MEIASPRGRFTPWTHGRHTVHGCVHLSLRPNSSCEHRPSDCRPRNIGHTDERGGLLVEPGSPTAVRHSNGAAFRKMFEPVADLPYLFANERIGTVVGPWSSSGRRSRSTAASSALRAAARVYR